MENSISAAGMPTKYRGTPFCRRANAVFESNRNRMARSTRFEAVTIIDSTQADVIREKQRERLISFRLVLRWMETDT